MVWIRTIEGIEKCKRKSRCRRCRKTIIKDEPRTTRNGLFCNRYPYKYFYCNKCGQKTLSLEIKELKQTIKELQKFKIDLRNLTNKSKEILIISALQNNK